MLRVVRNFFFMDLDVWWDGKFLFSFFFEFFCRHLCKVATIEILFWVSFTFCKFDLFDGRFGNEFSIVWVLIVCLLEKENIWKNFLVRLISFLRFRRRKQSPYEKRRFWHSFGSNNPNLRFISLLYHFDYEKNPINPILIYIHRIPQTRFSITYIIFFYHLNQISIISIKMERFCM